MSSLSNKKLNQNSKASSKLITPIPSNPFFLCNILADNAREYIMVSNQTFFGLFDVIYAFILAIVLGFMVRLLRLFRLHHHYNHIYFLFFFRIKQR